MYSKFYLMARSKAAYLNANNFMICIKRCVLTEMNDWAHYLPVSQSSFFFLLLHSLWPVFLLKNLINTRRTHKENKRRKNSSTMWEALCNLKLLPLFTPFRYPLKLLLSSNCGKLEIKMILYGYDGVEGVYLLYCLKWYNLYIHLHIRVLLVACQSS